MGSAWVLYHNSSVFIKYFVFGLCGSLSPFRGMWAGLTLVPSCVKVYLRKNLVVDKVCVGLTERVLPRPPQSTLLECSFMLTVSSPGRSFLPMPLMLRTFCLVLLGLFLAGLTGCVSADEHKRLQTAFDEQGNQLREAENDLLKARARIDELTNQLAEANRLANLNNDGVAALRRERDLLSTQLADLNQKYQDLLKMTGTPVLPLDVNAALRELAAQYPDLMEFDERLGMIRLKSDLTFDLGSTEVRPAAKAALAQLAQIFNMQKIAKNEIQVVGHTDDVPIRGGGPTAARNPDNWTLSTNRAWSVLDIFRAYGLSEARGMAGGWGDQRPIAPNAPGKRGNEKNRRVDIYIRPTIVPDNIVVSTPGAAPAPSTPRTTTPRTPTTRPTTPPASRPAASPGVPLPR